MTRARIEKNMKTIAIAALIILAICATASSVFDMLSKRNGTSELEIENAILRAQRDSLRTLAKESAKWAQYWADKAHEAETKQTIINNHYHENAETTLRKPFAIRSRIFAKQLNRLDSIYQHGN